MLKRSLLTALTLLPALGWANHFEEQLDRAVEELERADKAVKRARGPCKKNLSPELSTALENVEELEETRGRRAMDAQVFAAREQVAQLTHLAQAYRCPQKVSERLLDAIDALDEARFGLWSRGDRPPREAAFAHLPPLQVEVETQWNREPAVKLSVPELTLGNMQGRAFYLGTRVRSLEGPWSDWVTTEQWSVPADPFRWADPFEHYFSYRALTEQNYADGRFVGQLAIFDGNGALIAARETPFRLKTRLPRRPLPAVGQVVVAAAPARPAPPPPAPPPPSAPPPPAPAYQNPPPGYQPPPPRNPLPPPPPTRTQPPSYAPPPPNSAPPAPNPPPPPTRGHQPSYAPPPAPTPAPNYPPASNPPPATRNTPPERDCGTGVDPGCPLRRNGALPMDATTFSGLIATLAKNSNEQLRKEICEATFRAHALTALQLGLILDQFRNDQLRLEVARAAAPRVTNPSHALGFATKWRNSVLAKEYATLLSQQ